MKYSIFDWAGNEMDWGTFDNEDDAVDAIFKNVERLYPEDSEEEMERNLEEFYVEIKGEQK